MVGKYPAILYVLFNVWKLFVHLWNLIKQTNNWSDYITIYYLLTMIFKDVLLYFIFCCFRKVVSLLVKINTKNMVGKRLCGQGASKAKQMSLKKYHLTSDEMKIHCIFRSFIRSTYKFQISKRFFNLCTIGWYISVLLQIIDVVVFFSF